VFKILVIGNYLGFSASDLKFKLILIIK
jgi:hypothetical protein